MKNIRSTAFLIGGLLLMVPSIKAQVQLVKDINTSTVSTCGSDPLYEKAIVNNILYFAATDEANGEELWRTDGTPGGTWMVKDIYPGSSSSNPANFTDVNGIVFFTANNGADGVELWRSDGSSIGTYMIKDIYPGDNSSAPDNFSVLNSVLLFSADNGTNGNELWKSDGTNAGTVLVKDIYAGATTSGIYEMVALNSFVYFRANEGTNGTELWKSDGSTAGTVLVKDINSGISSSYPNQLIVLNGLLYFSADNGTTGGELWRSNGTTAGTYLVKDIFAGASSSNIYHMAKAGNNLFFRAESSTNDAELWKSDGTTSGTVLVKDIYAGATGSYPEYLTDVNGLLYFRANSATSGSELWVSDGTTLGTGIVKEIEAGANGSYPMFLCAIGNQLVFQAYSSTYGQEIWRSDGTTGGTYLLKDIVTGLNSSYPENMFYYNGYVYFRGYDDTNDAELWRTDGTSAGTVLFKNICLDGVSSTNYPYNGIKQMIDVNGTLFFIGNDGTSGFELWKSDGTDAGTVMIKDINPGITNGGIFDMINYNGTLIFNADNGVNGTELWKSDGTTAGTVMIKDIYPGSNSSLNGELFNVNDNLLFFCANEGVNGYELWKSDGTAAGTVLVKDIRPGNSSGPQDYVNLNGTLLFRAQDDTYGEELWKSDGTAAGTVLVKDIRSGAIGGLSANGVDLIKVNNTILFSANDGINGQELWKTDGTTAGTVMVKDIYPGSAPTYEYKAFISKIGNYIFFQANDGSNGSELWKSDGTTAGTILIKDIYPGTFNSLPVNIYNFNDTAFFTADDGINGYELWTSTGISSKTSLVKDIFPGAGSSSPIRFEKSGNTLFFLADNGVNGMELWKYKTPVPLQCNSAVTNVSCNGLSNGSIDVTIAGGTQPYNYAWSNGATTEDISGLAAGTYSLTANDALGWVVSGSYTVTQPAVLSTTQGSVSNITCNNGSNGSVNINVSGGTTPYTFAWSNSATTEDVSGLVAGTYSVLVTDAKGCTSSFNTTLTQPLAVSAFTNVIDASCNGGSSGVANVTVVMGVSPYSFLWSANSGSQTTQTAVGLAAGAYSVTVTDANGCTGTFTASITQPAAYTTSVSVSNVVCYAASNGSADLTVSGATPPYTYAWSNGTTTQDLTNVAAGSYSLTITDSKGCTTTQSANVTQPAVLDPHFTQKNISCFGLCNGTATVSPTGGTPPYIYSWQTVPVQTTATATGLCAGNYNITITDNKGCVNVPGMTIVQPATLSASVAPTPSTCNTSDGGASSIVNGGTLPYSYNWSNGASTQDITGLVPGGYTVTITDSSACTATASGTVTQTTLTREVCIVTVDSTSSKNVIVWEKPAVANLDSFYVYRDIASTYTKIGAVAFADPSEFVDTTQGVNPNITSYRYKIAAKDDCGGLSSLSLYHKTIHLQVSPAVPSGYQLDWDDYEGLSITQYRILRDTNNLGNWITIDSVPYGITSYTDLSVWDSVSYVIEIDHPNGCVISSKNPVPMASNLNSSRSNVYRLMDSTMTFMNEFNNQDLAFIYPNPNNGHFSISLMNRNSTGFNISVMNMIGEEIMNETVTGKNHCEVNLSHQAKGVYAVRITYGSSVMIRKMVIE